MKKDPHILKNGYQLTESYLDYTDNQGKKKKTNKIISYLIYNSNENDQFLFL